MPVRSEGAGRPLEVDALGGALLRAAGRAGVPAPATAAITAGLRRIGPAG